MTGPTRHDAIVWLDQGHAALQALFAGVNDEDMTRVGTIGTGEWSAKDLLGHIAFWEELALETIAAWRAGRRPPTEGGPAGDWPGAAAANARNQEQTAKQSLAQVRERAAVAYATIVQAIRTMADEEWQAPPFYPDARARTLGDLLGRVLGGSRGPFQHAGDHLADLEAYVAALVG